MIFKIKFGTDGWWGKIANEYTFENVRRCAQGFSNYLAGQSCQDEQVVVGFDKRFLSEQFAEAVAEVLAGNGFQVLLTNGATPTPVISYAVVDQKAVGAVNITASHNPPTDNGFKVRDRHGGAIAPAGLAEIENQIPDSLADVRQTRFEKAQSAGSIVLFDPAPAYRMSGPTSSSTWRSNRRLRD